MNRYVRTCTNNVNTSLTERYESIAHIRFGVEEPFGPATTERLLSRMMQLEADRQLTAKIA